MSSSPNFEIRERLLATAAVFLCAEGAMEISLGLAKPLASKARHIYCVGDNQVGLWSKTASVTVPA